MIKIVSKRHQKVNSVLPFQRGAWARVVNWEEGEASMEISLYPEYSLTSQVLINQTIGHLVKTGYTTLDISYLATVQQKPRPLQINQTSNTWNVSYLQVKE